MYSVTTSGPLHTDDYFKYLNSLPPLTDFPPEFDFGTNVIETDEPKHAAVEPAVYEQPVSFPTLVAEPEDLSSSSTPDQKIPNPSAAKTSDIGNRTIGKSSINTEISLKRAQQTRKSSRVYRQKKKMEFEELTLRVQTLEAEKQTLRETVARLQRENLEMIDRQNQMQKDFKYLVFQYQLLQENVEKKIPISGTPASTHSKSEDSNQSAFFA